LPHLVKLERLDDGHHQFHQISPWLRESSSLSGSGSGTRSLAPENTEAMVQRIKWRAKLDFRPKLLLRLA
jgi:hypothetical protein